ncbi:hypothetical protein [Halomonas piscis]|uniref:hypothetical protein n=1 Tax=Halomonas piscis TaxID=3031727 RepID=UPI0028A0434D|nr:hypothetical protein [Halomonas piscis]
MKIMPLVVAPLVFLAGCAGQAVQQQKNASQEQSGVVFSVSDASFTLTSECARSVEVDHDEAGRPMVVVSMKRSPECSERAFETVFAKTGQRLTVKHDGQVLTDDTLIVTPLDPAEPFRTPVEHDVQAQEIADLLD